MVATVVAVGLGLARWQERLRAVEVADDLRRLILAEVPGLEAALANDPVRATRLLLDWSANAADYALGATVDGVPPKTYLAKYGAIDVGSEYFDVYAKDKAGVYCGGQALFFVKVLRLFDLEGFIVDFGILEAGLTHVTVVVPLFGRFYIFDPTFNLVFPEPVDDMIAAARRGVAIRVIERGIPHRDFIGSNESGPTWAHCRTEPQRAGALYSCGIGSESFLGIYLDGWRDQLAAHGIPADSSALVRLLDTEIFEVGPSRDPEHRTAFLERMHALGVDTP